MKTLLKEYRLKVFSDGTIETKEIIEDDFNIILNDCSDKIKQIILVILQMKVIKEEAGNINIDYSYLYNESVNNVAENIGVVRATIHDKLERGMAKSVKDMKDMMEDFFTGKNQNIKQLLLDSIKKTHKEKQDKRALEELFNRLFI